MRTGGEAHEADHAEDQAARDDERDHVDRSAPPGWTGRGLNCRRIRGLHPLAGTRGLRRLLKVDQAAEWDAGLA